MSQMLAEPVATPTAEVAADPRAELGRLIRLAVPNIGTNVARMLMGFTDFVMVSWLGTAAQAAVSPASFMMFALLSFGGGISMCVTTFAAQALGRGEPHTASHYAWQCVPVALLSGILVVPMIWLLPALIGRMGHAPEVAAAEIDYLRYAMWCVVPAAIVAGLDGFFNGVQRPGVSVISIFVALASNVVLNYGLILGRLGLPEMGIAGAALATLIGWSLRAAVLLIAFLATAMNGRYATRAGWRPSARRLADLVRVGAPTSLQWLLDVLAWALFMSSLMGHFGTAAMAATNIAVQYTYVAFMPAIGIGMALTSLVGHAIGEGRPELAALRTRLAAAVNVLFMGAVGLGFFLFRGWLVERFTNDAEVIRLGLIAMIWAALFQVCDAVSITFGCALRGAGDTRAPAIYVVLYAWGVFVLGGWYVSRHVPALGFNGPWLMCTLYMLLYGATLARRFFRGRWRDIRIFGSSAR